MVQFTLRRFKVAINIFTNLKTVTVFSGDSTSIWRGSGKGFPPFLLDFSMSEGCFLRFSWVLPQISLFFYLYQLFPVI